MIPGLEYEQQPPHDNDNGNDRQHGHHPPAPSPANSVQSVDISSPNNMNNNNDPHQLHRRRPNYSHGNNTSYASPYGTHNNNNNNTNNGHHHAQFDSYNDANDKYSKQHHTPAKRMVRRLDFFPKMESDMVIRTERGGQFTLVGYGLMLLLIVAEIGAWVGGNRETVEHIVVDTSLGKKMRVNLDITFPSLHCNDLHLDVIDVAGDTQLDLSDTLFKHRLRLDGTPLTSQKIVAEANIKAEQDKLQRDALKKNLPTNYCGPCYGAHETEDQCCNTCAEVMDAYKKKRWNDQAVLPLAEQCIREGKTRVDPKKMSKGEGCNLSGYMTVNRVAGNFHVAMGEGVDRDGRHIHQFLPEDRPNFNASHVIHELSFMDEEYGDLMSVVVGGAEKVESREEEEDDDDDDDDRAKKAFEKKPAKKDDAKKKKKGKLHLPGERSMNGVSKVVTEETGTTGLFQYFIKVVPTKYKGEILKDLGVPLGKDAKSSEILETNRYFYTERFRPLIGEVHEEAILSGDPDRGTAGAHVGGKFGGTLHEKVEHHDTQNAVLPGVFFVYEIYPFAVEVTKNKVPLMHLLIRIMATVGGVFTMMSWIDGALYSRQKKRGIR